MQSHEFTENNFWAFFWLAISSFIIIIIIPNYLAISSFIIIIIIPNYLVTIEALGAKTR